MVIAILINLGGHARRTHNCLLRSLAEMFDAHRTLVRSALFQSSAVRSEAPRAAVRPRRRARLSSMYYRQRCELAAWRSVSYSWRTGRPSSILEWPQPARFAKCNLTAGNLKKCRPGIVLATGDISRSHVGKSLRCQLRRPMQTALREPRRHYGPKWPLLWRRRHKIGSALLLLCPKAFRDELVASASWHRLLAEARAGGFGHLRPAGHAAAPLSEMSGS